MTRYEIALGKPGIARKDDLESFRVFMERTWQNYKKMYIDPAYGKDLDNIGESIGLRRHIFWPNSIMDRFEDPFESDTDFRNRISTVLHDAHMNNILTK